MEKWIAGSAEAVDQHTKTSSLIEGRNTFPRFVSDTENGEVLIAFNKDKIRLSMQRTNGTYCLFEIPVNQIMDFLGSGNYHLSDLRDAIYEDPLISGLSREEATAYLGISPES